jgi:hypothetical protein
VNAWFGVCGVAYRACTDGTVDKTSRLGWDTSAGRESAAYFRLAMALLRAFVDTGVARVDDSGVLIDNDGNLFAPRAWLDGAGRLLAALDEPPGGGWNFTLGVSSGFCIFFCLEVGMSGNGLYARPGVGFAVDTSSIVFDNENPQCGTER